MREFGPDPEGATPLGPDELDGLKPHWVTTRADLNAAEAANVARGMAWATRRRRTRLLSEDFAIALHRRMFGDVWRWAGTLRTRQTNIGIAPHLIRQEMRQLNGDIEYWIAARVHDADEIAVRLHHRMVLIHPFANGNGRHTRLMADLLITSLGAEPFSWGGSNLSANSDLRQAYIAALRQADGHDIRALRAFARA